MVKIFFRAMLPLFLLFAGCGSTGFPDSAIPLQEGNFWIYNTIRYQSGAELRVEKKKMVVLAAIEIEDLETYPLLLTSLDKISADTTYYTADDFGVYRMLQSGKNWERQLYMPEPRIEYTDFTIPSSAGVLIDSDTLVTVDAGTFPCRLYAFEEGYEIFTVPGIGIVRIIDREDSNSAIIVDLIDYVIAD